MSRAILLTAGVGFEDYNQMLRFQHLLLLVLCGLLVGAMVAPRPQEQADPAAAAQDDAEPTIPQPQRVVVQVTRFELVGGVIEREEPDLLVIRDPVTDQVRSFIKSRLLKLTRLVEPQPGQHGTVVLTDGTRRDGIIISDEFDRVLLDIEGIRTRFDRAVVDHVELQPTPEELYEQFKSAIRPDMYDRRMELCQWLFDQRLYYLAEKELLSLKADRPDYAGLDQLLRVVQAQVLLLSDEELDESAPLIDGDAEEAPVTGPVEHRDMLPDELVTASDVNIIRIYELDFENPPRVAISPDTIRKLIENYASHSAIPADADGRSSLFRKDPIDVLRLMFEVRARDLYPEVEVLSEPASMNLFRQRVHNTWLINNCATSNCHGGVNAGRLFLHRHNHLDERVRYTNFLILDRLELDPSHPLINYDEPVQSRIIQFGLPATEARDPHPDVPGWRPVFNKGNRKMLEDAVDWIRSMYIPRPDYPVDYQPPSLIDEAASGTGADGVDR